MPVHRIVGKDHLRATTSDQTTYLENGTPVVTRHAGPVTRIPIGTLITDATPEELKAFPFRFEWVSDADTLPETPVVPEDPTVGLSPEEREALAAHPEDDRLSVSMPLTRATGMPLSFAAETTMPLTAELRTMLLRDARGETTADEHAAMLVLGDYIKHYENGTTTPEMTVAIETLLSEFGMSLRGD